MATKKYVKGKNSMLQHFNVMVPFIANKNKCYDCNRPITQGILCVGCWAIRNRGYKF